MEEAVDNSMLEPRLVHGAAIRTIDVPVYWSIQNVSKGGGPELLPCKRETETRVQEPAKTVDDHNSRDESRFASVRDSSVRLLNLPADIYVRNTRTLMNDSENYCFEWVGYRPVWGPLIW